MGLAFENGRGIGGGGGAGQRPLVGLKPVEARRQLRDGGGVGRIDRDGRGDGAGNGGRRRSGDLAGNLTSRLAGRGHLALQALDLALQLRDLGVLFGDRGYRRDGGFGGRVRQLPGEGGQSDGQHGDDRHDEPDEHARGPGSRARLALEIVAVGRRIQRIGHRRHSGRAD